MCSLIHLRPSRRLIEETQPGHDLGNGRCSELALANQIELVVVNLLTAEAVGRLREILGEHRHVPHVGADRGGRAVADFEVFDKLLT